MYVIHLQQGLVYRRHDINACKCNLNIGCYQFCERWIRKKRVVTANSIGNCNILETVGQ